MATRKERRIKMIARHTWRRISAHSHKYPRWIGGVGQGHGGGKVWQRPDLGKMSPLILAAGSVNPVPHSFPGQNAAPGWPFVITAIGRAMPPNVKITHLGMINRRLSGIHQQWSQIGYHLKRSKKLGHKRDRMNGYDRQIMGATWHAVKEGYYPAWDPLGRHPTPTDIDNGAAFIDIDWRWGVTGNFPP